MYNASYVKWHYGFMDGLIEQVGFKDCFYPKIPGNKI